jgi:hypothetical protein
MGNLIKYLISLTIVPIISFLISVLILQITNISLDSLSGLAIVTIVFVFVSSLYDCLETWKKGEKIKVFSIFFEKIGFILLPFGLMFFSISTHDSNIFESILFFIISVAFLVSGIIILNHVSTYECEVKKVNEILQV